MGRRLSYRPVGPPPEQHRLDGPFFTNQLIIAIAAIVLLILIVIVGVAYFFIQNQNLQKEFGPLLTVCQGYRADAASTYTASPGPHPAVAVESSSGKPQLDTWLIPRPARAQSLAETQLVLCLEKAELIYLESCPYTSRTDRGRVTHRLDRYYYVQEARLIEAKTGRAIDTHTFAGQAPRACDKTEYFKPDEPISTLKGPLISTTSVQQWLQPHLVVK